MFRVRLFALATAFIMVCPLVLLSAAGAGAGPAPAPPTPAPSWDAAGVPPLGLGDWFVNGSEVLENRTVVLDGCLTVGQKGELSISNSTLIVKCAFGREHQIRVATGGKLRILNGSTVSAFDPDNRFGFRVEPGALVELRGSRFISAGEQERYLLEPNWPPTDPDYDTVVGGVIIESPLADIQNCTFMGSPISLTFLKTDGLLKNCTFRDNFVGVLSHNARTTFENCAFLRNNMGQVHLTRIGAGVWSWRSVSVFRDCTFNDSYTGISVDNSTCTATGCAFTRNVVGGVFVCGFMSYQDPETVGPCGPSDTTVEDCGFFGNTYGIARGIEGWLGTEELHVENGVFRDNTVFGIWWENRIDPGTKYQPAPSWGVKPRATWNVTGASEVSGDLMMFNGSIDIGPGGSLGLCRTVLRMDGASPGETGIQVRTGGKLSIAEGSTLTATKPEWPYSLACRPGSALVLDGSLLRDCGWNAGLPELSGPFIETRDVIIRRSVVEACPTALVMNGAGKGLVDGSRLSGKNLAVRLDNSSLELVNSTSESTGISNVALSDGSRLICLNSSLDRELADFRDDESRLEVGWYLDVLALRSDGRPAAGAGLTIQDASGNEVQKVTADAAGRVREMVLWETFITRGDRTVFSPHRLECRSGDITNKTALTMDRSRSLTVILEDAQPPSVSILAPAPGALLNSGSVRVLGTARDNLALESVVLTVDGFERHTLLKDPGGQSLRLDWNLTIPLPEGSHSIQVVAADTSGNSDFEIIPFSIDFTVPRIVILLPREGALTNISEIAVSGLMEPGTDVSVNGVEARTLGGTFNAMARLSEGDNVITARAVDAAGNMNSTSTFVRLDTMPPRLEVSFFPDALFVNRPEVRLSGTMEFGSSVTVNGRPVVLPGLSSNFTTPVFLAQGNNTIGIRAQDAAGNVNNCERLFVLDTVAPSFRVLFPPEGFQTNEPNLTISLVAESGTDVSAGAGTVRVPGPPGSPVNVKLNCTLAEGANTIVVRARDEAGNTFTDVLEVFLDTRAPELVVQSPPDGFATSNYSVYIIGTTELGAAVSVNGEPVAVGYSGDFSIELNLMPGRNRMIVASADALGNVNTLTINVTRVAGEAAMVLSAAPGPDWPFLGFLLVAAAASVFEGYWAARRLRRPESRPGPAKGGG